MLSLREADEKKRRTEQTWAGRERRDRYGDCGWKSELVVFFPGRSTLVKLPFSTAGSSDKKLLALGDAPVTRALALFTHSSSRCACVRAWAGGGEREERGRRELRIRNSHSNCLPRPRTAQFRWACIIIQ